MGTSGGAPAEGGGGEAAVGAGGSGGAAGGATGELLFTFEQGLEGWLNEDAGGPYDSASYIADIGNPGGSALLNGSDLGVADGEPNAWIRRSVEIPSGATNLRFDTRAQNDGALRVRVGAGSAVETLLAWQVVSGGSWVSVELAIGSYAGQVVTLYFEQDDDGEGEGEHRYVDNIRLGARP